jgi:hypothetical protein
MPPSQAWNEHADKKEEKALRYIPGRECTLTGIILNHSYKAL